jgi:hypothetical protein
LFVKQLTGPVNLSNASAIEAFFAFENKLSGQLVLPANHCNLWMLLVHSNFFSCDLPMVGDCPLWNSSRSLPESKLCPINKSAAECSKGLAAPGNKFQAKPGAMFERIAGPSWDVTSSVPFLWEGTLCQTWRWPLMGYALGITVLLATVATTGVIFLPEEATLRVNLIPAVHSIQRGLPAVRTRLWRFVRFKPLRGIGVTQLWCAKALAWLAVPCVVMVVLLNLFARSHLYECGDQLTKYLTVAYVDDGMSEWALAICATAFPCAAARLVRQFQLMLQTEYESPAQPPAASRAAILWMYVKWAVPLVVCTAVPFGYAIATSLPAESLDANLDLEWVLPLVSESASLSLSIITTAAIPWWCRKVSHQAYGAAGNPLLTSRLMQLARLWISILAPALAVALIHEDCLGRWKLRWDRCVGEDANYFDLSFRELSGYALHMKTDISSLLCGTRYKSGRCSRAVIENLGLLLGSKLAYSSFLLPANMLVLSTPFWRRTKEAAVRCFKPSYIAAFDVDSELAEVVM